MSLFGEYGASKIGSTFFVSLGASAWTEQVLTVLQQGRVARPTSFVITSNGTVYLAQANHLHTIGGVVLTFPVAPDTGAPASGPGYFELAASVPWRIDVETPAENSLFMWASAATLVRITELIQTPFDVG